MKMERLYLFLEDAVYCEVHEINKGIEKNSKSTLGKNSEMIFSWAGFFLSV